MINFRPAIARDSRGIAKVYVESWRDTYAGLLPNRVLLGMSVEQLTESWRRRFKGTSFSFARHGAVYVAEHEAAGIVGFADSGPSRDKKLPYRAEVYTLYVAPDFVDSGVGRSLLDHLFDHLISEGVGSVIIWALADNPNRHFYSAIGGRLVAECVSRYWGENLREMGYGWSDLRGWREQRAGGAALARRNRNRDD